ncbi:hypothetical protein F383_03528 [Gossypium arboreum]|uniref:Uncharacterized protein n=1 Tax=Gossypium arboreum TaxID=29729 RepID=A0A0B0NFM8_GOSAR|nr:hypothetical protein F383_03528 [Gossypium arboreum]
MRWIRMRLFGKEELQSKSRLNKAGQIWSFLKVFALFSLYDNEQRGVAVGAQISLITHYKPTPNPTLIKQAQTQFKPKP